MTKELREAEKRLRRAVFFDSQTRSDVAEVLRELDRLRAIVGRSTKGPRDYGAEVEEAAAKVRGKGKRARRAAKGGSR